jgi:PilZ domain
MIPSMQVTRTSPDAFTVAFESEEDLREEHRVNLSVGGLRLPTDDRPPLHALLEVTLRGPTGAEAKIRATVVAPLPDGIALSIEAEAGDLLERLLAGAAEKGQTLADRLRTIDEVVRVAKSSFLNYQTAEVIISTGEFMASLDVRVALVHNPKTPPPFALRILPTLPESELRRIARGAATSMALKQAALKRLQRG